MAFFNGLLTLDRYLLTAIASNREAKMGISIKRDQLLGRARRLYVQGMNLKEIAEHLGVSRDAVARWFRQDLARGLSWDLEREEEQKLRPARILKLLERRFGRMVLEGERREQEGAPVDDDYESRLLKMLQIINGFCKSTDELTLILRALDEFAEFCSENLTREELDIARKAVEKFGDHLGRQNQ